MNTKTAYYKKINLVYCNTHVQVFNGYISHTICNLSKKFYQPCSTISQYKNKSVRRDSIFYIFTFNAGIFLHLFLNLSIDTRKTVNYVRLLIFSDACPYFDNSNNEYWAKIFILPFPAFKLLGVRLSELNKLRCLIFLYWFTNNLV